MKPSTIVLWCVMALFLAGNAFAGDDKAPASTFNKERAVKNLIIGLGMNNCGVEHDATCLLGDSKSTEAVIPPLKTLHEDAGLRVLPDRRGACPGADRRFARYVRRAAGREARLEPEGQNPLRLLL